jgi:hypothetical protein
LDLGLLIFNGFVALLWAVTLSLDLAGRGNWIRILRRSAPPGPGQLLIGAGASLECGTFFLSGLARYRHWPDQRYDDMLHYLLPLMLVAATLLIAGVAVQIRSRRPTR